MSFALAVAVGTIGAGVYQSQQAAKASQAASAVDAQTFQTQREDIEKYRREDAVLAEAQRLRDVAYRTGRDTEGDTRFDEQFGQQAARDAVDATYKTGSLAESIRAAKAAESLGADTLSERNRASLAQEALGANTLAERNRASLQAEALGRDTLGERERASRVGEQFQQSSFDKTFGAGENRYAFEQGAGANKELSRRAREDAINAATQERFQEQQQANLGRLDPYATAGTSASNERSALLGLSGAEAQQAAMGRFTESPGQAFLRERQERTLLRNSAAIGGLGGGNVRTKLQEQAFGRAQTDYDNQLARLGAVAGQGMQSAQIANQTQAGPARVTTGTDLGVNTATYTPTKV